MIKKCKKCGKVFVMGVNGTVNGCDECQGIVRDKSGYFWLPDERQHTYLDIETDMLITVSRAEALDETEDI